ncbi:MAG: hypothetical protein ABWX94_01190, partial [Candidatus Saccharimonadales bacterium]
ELPLEGLKSIGWLATEVVTGNHPHRPEAATLGRRVEAVAKLAGLVAISPFLAVGTIGTFPGRFIQNRRRGLAGDFQRVVPRRGEPPRQAR